MHKQLIFSNEVGALYIAPAQASVTFLAAISEAAAMYSNVTNLTHR